MSNQQSQDLRFSSFPRMRESSSVLKRMDTCFHGNDGKSQVSESPESLQQAFAAALLDPDLPCPPGLRTWNGSDPAQRFAVYRNNVLVSLVDALADTFPVTRELVGDEFFRAMASLFVRQMPPRSTQLVDYGAGMPAFIATFAPAASVPYLADVARLEYLRIQACHAADALPLAAEQLARVLAQPEQLPALRLIAHPALRLLCSPYAIVSLWAAHQGLIALGDVEPYHPESALVVRAGLEVEVITMPPGGDILLAHLLDGLSLGEAAARASTACDHFDLTANLALLLRHGAFSALHLPVET